MGRAEVAAVVGHMLQECGAFRLEDIICLIEDDDGRAHMLDVLRSDACRIAAAQTSAHGSAPTANVLLHVTVSAPPPPPINVSLQVAVPRVPTADVGTATERCRTRAAQAQTAFSLYGITRSAQTHTTALSMVEAGTTTEGTICKANVSTDTFLDKVGGHVKRAVQTEEAVVPASDYKQLGDSLAASVDEAQQAKVALAKRTADLEGLLMAIIRRKRIVMDRMRYHVYCEGEASDMGEPPDGVYEVSYCPLK